MRILSLLSPFAFLLFLFLCQSGVGRSEPTVVAGVTITSPPLLQPSGLADLTRRNASLACSYGTCVSSCLSQGAFCCNPGGALVPPNWVCDNGACITSVRGDTGIVDCYDPDNPSGTTQSCVDFKATASCASTDKCYTCESTQPYCHWQTWIETSSPTLRWFSCVTEKQADATFLAATLTGNTPTQTSTTSTSTIPKSTALLITSTSTSAPTSTLPSISSSSTASIVISTGAIIGIAVGGGVLLLICIILAFCLLRRRAATTPGAQAALPHPPATAELASPIYYPDNSQGSTYTEEHWRWHSVDGSAGFGSGISSVPTPPPLPHTLLAELPVQSREAERILGIRARHQLD